MAKKVAVLTILSWLIFLDSFMCSSVQTTRLKPIFVQEMITDFKEDVNVCVTYNHTFVKSLSHLWSLALTRANKLYSCRVTLRFKCFLCVSFVRSFVL